MKTVLCNFTKVGLTLAATLGLIHLASAGSTVFWVTLFTASLSVFALKKLGVYDCVDNYFK